MKIYSLDVSTTNIGRAFIDKENNIYKLKIFQATGNIKDRIKNLYQQIKDDLKTFDYDTLVLTRAVHAKVNQNIAMLEGMLLSLTIDDDTNFVAYPDVSWYCFIGSVQDQRPLKKKNTLDFMGKTLGIEFVDYNEIWSGGKMDKISGITKDGKVFQDDISDAFAAGYLLDKKQSNDNLKHFKNDLQSKINKLSKSIKKYNNMIVISKDKIKNLGVNLTTAKKQYSLTNSKTDENKVNKRIEWLENENKKLIDLERVKKDLIDKRQKLRDEKNGVKNGN